MKSHSTDRPRVIQDGGIWVAAVSGHSIGNKSNSSIDERRNIALLVLYGVILCHEWWKSGKTHVGGSVAEWSKVSV